MQTANIDQTAQGERIDSYITKIFKIPSRSFLKNNWENLVSLNGELVKPSYKLRVGDTIQLEEEKIDTILKESATDVIIPQESPLNIVKETENFLIINKPKGIAVHPGVGNSQNTLVNYVVGYLTKNGLYDNRMDRGGIVHRLDKSVSGLIVFAKNLESQKSLQKQFEEHSINKIYLAKVNIGKNASKEFLDYIPTESLDSKQEIDKLVSNSFEIDNSWFKAEGYIRRSNLNRMKMVFKTYPSPNAKYCLSYLKPLNRNEILIIIKTGRMYQIRATLESLGINIVGDTLFETRKGGKIPNSIELESVLLSIRDLNGETFIFRLV